MRIYLVGGADARAYGGTLHDAQELGKSMVEEGDDWRDIEVAEIELQVDKAGVLSILNGMPIYTETGRKWEFASQRMGLKETT